MNSVVMLQFFNSSKLQKFSILQTLKIFIQRFSLLINCPYSDCFWSIFSRIWTEYGKYTLYLSIFSPNAGKFSRCGWFSFDHVYIFMKLPFSVIFYGSWKRGRKLLSPSSYYGIFSETRTLTKAAKHCLTPHLHIWKCSMSKTSNSLKAALKVAV